jgi:hypothetical protein
MISRQNALEAASFLGSDQNFAAAMAAAQKTAQKTARKRIWDLSGHYHCSIIGTCLSAAELRKLLAKLDMAAPGDSDHDLHGRGVGLAGRQDMAGKLLNKALDDRHQVTIKRYDRATGEAELRALWQQDVKAGDIPGGYWAVLTHPLAGHELVREVFGYVHMLSHLVGAANRADIRRLQQLEAQNAELTHRLERQQAQIHDLAAARDAAMRLAEQNLSGRMAVSAPDESREEEITALRRQLAEDAGRRALAEERLAQAQAVAAQAQEAAREAGQRAAALQAELDAVERGLRTGAKMPADAAPMALDGLTVLYVGGRPTQMPHIRQAAADRGGKLLHHDGGIEDNDLILASMVSRADIIFFPVDCVSHSAVGTVKRTCRSEGKKYVPLRSAAVTSFIAGLSA